AQRRHLQGRKADGLGTLRQLLDVIGVELQHLIPPPRSDLTHSVSPDESLAARLPGNTPGPEPPLAEGGSTVRLCGLTGMGRKRQKNLLCSLVGSLDHRGKRLFSPIVGPKHGKNGPKALIGPAAENLCGPA